MKRITIIIFAIVITMMVGTTLVDAKVKKSTN